MDDNILITIIMPSLNSEKSIEKALVSIRMQDIDQSKIEILVVDGGSTDNTIKIAQQYAAKILPNHKVVPEAAKNIGFLAAKGCYMMFMDSDECFTNNSQIRKRLKLFEALPDLKIIAPAGLLTPPGYSKFTEYVNSIGDPFSYFVYRMDGSNLPQSIKGKYNTERVEEGTIYRLKPGDILPIVDAGGLIDLSYARKYFSGVKESLEFVTIYFDWIADKTGCFGIVDNDFMLHYGTANFRHYFKKLKFRVINNINNKSDSYAGFASRSSANKKLNNRKYLYPIYCLLFPWVLWDAFYISIKKKNLTLMVHFIYTYYVLFQVIYLYTLKLMGRNIENKRYG